MRALIATTANDGPLRPAAAPAPRRCAAAGHERAGRRARVVRRRRSSAPVFAHDPFGDVPPELIGPVMARLPALSLRGGQRDRWSARCSAGSTRRRRCPAVVAAIERWRPDVVVRESGRARLPGRGRARPASRTCTWRSGCTRSSACSPTVIAEPLAGAGPAGRAARAAALVARRWRPSRCSARCPSVLDRRGRRRRPAPAASSRFRDPGLVAPPGDLPPSWGDPDHPLVYVTFGSVTGSLPPFAECFARRSTRWPTSESGC